MPDLLVRKMDAKEYERLRRRAKAQGKSMGQTARELLSAQLKPNKDEAWAEADRIRAKIRARVGHDLPDSTPGIREDRDNR